MSERIETRTMAEIAREAILAEIREGRRSASMSGIELYPKPWADLDMANDYDWHIISTNLTWNGKRHDYTGLQRLTETAA